MKNKNATIILNHGSRNEESNKQFKSLISQINKKNSKIYGAFLEYGKPKFERVVKEIINRNIIEITIFPLFLFGGYHVREDIPEKIIELKDQYPELNFTLMEPLGLREDFPNFIKRQLYYKENKCKVI